MERYGSFGEKWTGGVKIGKAVMVYYGTEFFVLAVVLGLGK